MSDAEAARGEGVITKASPRTVAETVAQFTALAQAKGLRVFAVIDQAAEARQAGLELRDTVLVVFGNPAAGPLAPAQPGGGPLGGCAGTRHGRDSHGRNG